MLQVKLPYYPKVIATVTETPFGVMEISQPDIYEKPLQGKTIVKVDTLECLRELFGDECLLHRIFIYSILSGSEYPYDAVKVFASFYRKYPSVTSYVNDKYTYGDESLDLFKRCVLPLREMVEQYSSEMSEKLLCLGGKFLVKTHDILYFAYNDATEVSKLKGVELIC